MGTICSITGPYRQVDPMPSDPSFELIERGAFGDSRSWRLKESQIRFRGRISENVPMPAVQPIPAHNEQIARFVSALDFLGVWDWRADYNPMECGYCVDD